MINDKELARLLWLARILQKILASSCIMNLEKAVVANLGEFAE